ncbi:uncharacterized protein LOC143219720 [Lasioglossum baleicum]|uniref:uncharacterized protein LOC143219720 n=1 Tax=Lasioglossum baleicum TaxID=434251 RepID=UPI003FCC2CB8
MRITKETFDYILEGIRSKIEKESNFRKCISPEERLVVTLRFLYCLVLIALDSLPIYHTGDEDKRKYSVSTMSDIGDKVSDNVEQSGEKTAKVCWVYNLRKDELLQELRNRNITHNENNTVDEFRKILVNEIKTQDRNSKLEPKEDPENQQQDTANTSTKMTSDTPKLEFCLEKNDWEVFVDRLEVYFEAKSTPETKKAATMLTKLDEEAFKLIRNLCAPSKPLEKTYNELKALMTNHLNPAPSEVMERCKFNQAKQEQTETVADFIARLKKLSLHCKFIDHKTALRDQLVRGIRDHDTRVELFKKSALTFDDALKEAIARESAMKNASGSLKTLENGSFQQDVYALNSSTQGRRQTSKYEKQPRGQQNFAYPNNNLPAQQQTQRPNEGYNCYCCGKPNHRASFCRYRFRYCKSCGGRGHLEQVCRDKKSPAVKFLNTAGDGRTPIQEEDSENDYDCHDFYPLNVCYATDRINYSTRPVTPSNTNNINAEPLFLEILLNSKLLKMEIDTGTYVTVLSEHTKEMYFKDLKLKKTNHHLRGYANDILRPIGLLDDIDVTIDNKTLKLSCFVLPGMGPPLIGRQWFAAFGLWPLEIGISRIGKDRIQTLKVIDVKAQLIKEFEPLFSNTPGLFNKGKLVIHLKENAKPVALKARHVPYAMKSLIEEELTRLVKLGHVVPVDVSEWATPIVPVIKSNGKIRICGDFKLTINPHIITNKNPLPRIEDVFAAMQGGEKFSELDLSHAYMQIPVDENSQVYLTIVTHLGLYRYTKMAEGIRMNRIELLGFVIDKNGLHKSKSKVKAIVEAPTPENTKQLLSFLGKSFFWNDECENSFSWDQNEEILLACDASSYGLSAILLHKYKDGSERPIAFASKRIPKGEMHRAIIDKEASAIVFGFKRFYDYIFGREITLRTDHKPLQYIFGPKSGIPLTATSRLQRWAYYLSGFRYKIEIVIPKSLQPAVLKELHLSHLGIVKIKMHARSYVWWPGIDHDIEQLVKSCIVCLECNRPT